MEAEKISLNAESLINDASVLSVHSGFSAQAKRIENRRKGAFYAEDITLNAREAIRNEDALIAANQTLGITAQDILNTSEAVLYAGEELSLEAAGKIINQSAAIESEKDIVLKANEIRNEKTVFKADWDVTNQMVGYEIPHLDEDDYYRAERVFNRNVHTGVIREETADSSILAARDIEINAKGLENRYSKIMAGGDLNINAEHVLNYGYQGTIVIADRGDDTHYWKYKDHGTLHIHCPMVYGETRIPYAYDEIIEEPIARLGILSAGNKVNVNAAAIDNKTHNAGGQAIGYKTITTSPVTVGRPEGKLLLSLDPAAGGLKGLNDKLYTVNAKPSAKYLVETNEKYASYQNFLSSDYLLERVKSDPEKVMKRLGDGFFEQKLVTEQIMNLTGRRFLNGYTSDYEEFKALMENGALAAQRQNLTVGVALTKEQMAALTADMVWLVEKEIDGQKVLVPEVYLASLKEGDLTEGGAVIAGADIELYAKEDLTNLGTLKANNQTKIEAKNIKNQAGTIKGEDWTIVNRVDRKIKKLTLKESQFLFNRR